MENKLKMEKEECKETAKKCQESRETWHGNRVPSGLISGARHKKLKLTSGSFPFIICILIAITGGQHFFWDLLFRPLGIHLR
jgi:hypothetical protein